MVHCNYCGKDNIDGALTCANCGSDLSSVGMNENPNGYNSNENMNGYSNNGNMNSYNNNGYETNNMNNSYGANNNGNNNSHKTAIIIGVCATIAALLLCCCIVGFVAKVIIGAVTEIDDLDNYDYYNTEDGSDNEFDYSMLGSDLMIVYDDGTVGITADITNYKAGDTSLPLLITNYTSKKLTVTTNETTGTASMFTTLEANGQTLVDLTFDGSDTIEIDFWVSSSDFETDYITAPIEIRDLNTDRPSAEVLKQIQNEEIIEEITDSPNYEEQDEEQSEEIIGFE